MSDFGTRRNGGPPKLIGGGPQNLSERGSKIPTKNHDGQSAKNFMAV